MDYLVILMALKILKGMFEGKVLPHKEETNNITIIKKIKRAHKLLDIGLEQKN